MLFKKGFTLVELAVVLVIIGVLAAIVLVNVGSFTIQGRDTKRIGDLRNIQPLLSQYQLKVGTFPDRSSFLNTPAGNDMASDLVTQGVIPAVTSLSKPPRSGENYYYWACSSSGATGPKNHYIVGAVLEQSSTQAPQLYSGSVAAVPSGWTCNGAPTCDPVNLQYCLAF